MTASETRTQVDLLVTAGHVMTVDGSNRIFSPGAIAVQGDRIADVGPADDIAARYTGRRQMNYPTDILMPGLVDAYAHAGHGMIKALYTTKKGWPASPVYFNGTTPEWWRADGLLTAVERIRFGVTCGNSILGATPARADDPVYADEHAKAVEEAGVRDVLGVGPPDPFLGHIPFPWKSTDWRSGKPVTVEFTYDDCMRVSEEVVRRWHRGANGRIHVCLAIPYLCGMNPRFMAGHHHHLYSKDDVATLRAKGEEARDFADRLDVLIHTHGTRGTIEFAADKLGSAALDGILSKRVVFAHGHGFSLRDVAILARTGPSVVWVPFGAWGIKFGPAPIPELEHAGVRACVATDGAAPFHISDLFVDIHRAMFLLAEKYMDATVLQEGHGVRLVTIEAARCLGLDDEIGSLEKGKKADFILIDTNRPHLVPTLAIPQLVAYYVRGNDVRTTVIDGKVVMDDGRVTTVNEQAVLDLAREEAAKSFERVDVRGYTEMPNDFWRGWWP
jgi:cytosine/adenosine deaminase-related metal-dependent hydrolase